MGFGEILMIQEIKIKERINKKINGKVQDVLIFQRRIVQQFFSFFLPETHMCQSQVCPLPQKKNNNNKIIIDQ